jgi:cysteinylglycine-S-conjugate dipeptidase
MSTEQLREAIHQLMPQAREDLRRMVAIKSVADANVEPIEECLKAADYVVQAFSTVGLQNMRLVDMPQGHPAVLGEYPAPAGAPTVLLYSHYDVQPPLDEAAWQTPAFELTERNGRWYGRGSSDCKGNIVVHLAALRALGPGFPVGIKFLAEGSEEQGLGELEDYVPQHADQLQADTVLVCDTGNFEVGLPTLTTTLRGMAMVDVRVRTLGTPMHSGMFGGSAPDALVALIQMLSTLHDAAGNTTVRGLDNGQRWAGVQYEEDKLRVDANVLDGVALTGSGSVADMLWARPSVTMLGIDCPRIVGASGVVQAEAGARLSLRVPPGVKGRTAQDALIAHLRAVAPWNVQLDLQPAVPGDPFQADTSGPAYRIMRAAMQTAYGRGPTTAGLGGSIPLCNILQESLPRSEIMLLGVEEPQCLIHAPNESVDPAEIEHMALTEAIFLQEYGANHRRRLYS